MEDTAPAVPRVFLVPKVVDVPYADALQVVPNLAVVALDHLPAVIPSTTETDPILVIIAVVEPELHSKLTPVE